MAFNTETVESDIRFTKRIINMEERNISLYSEPTAIKLFGEPDLLIRQKQVVELKKKLQQLEEDKLKQEIQSGLILIKQGIIDSIKMGNDTNSKIATHLELRGQKQYLTWEVLNMLVEEGRISKNVSKRYIISSQLKNKKE